MNPTIPEEVLNEIINDSTTPPNIPKEVLNDIIEDSTNIRHYNSTTNLDPKVSAHPKHKRQTGQSTAFSLQPEREKIDDIRHASYSTHKSSTRTASSFKHLDTKSDQVTFYKNQHWPARHSIRTEISNPYGTISELQIQEKCKCDVKCPDPCLCPRSLSEIIKMNQRPDKIKPEVQATKPFDTRGKCKCEVPCPDLCLCTLTMAEITELNRTDSGKRQEGSLRWKDRPRSPDRPDDCKCEIHCSDPCLCPFSLAETTYRNRNVCTKCTKGVCSCEKELRDGLEKKEALCICKKLCLCKRPEFCQCEQCLCAQQKMKIYLPGTKIESVSSRPNALH